MVKLGSISILFLFIFKFTSAQDIDHIKEHVRLRHHSVHANSPLSNTSSNNNIQRLDSIIEYNYNEATLSWDSKYLKDEYSYDDNIITDYKLFHWNQTENNWENAIKEEYLYEEHSHMTSYISYVWTDNTWLKDSKEDYTYNTDNQLKESIEYIWSEESNQWKNSRKRTYSYNDQEKEDVELIYQYDAEAKDWVVKEKIYFEYIEDKLHYIFKWINIDGQWKLDEKQWYLYDNIQWSLYTKSYYKWFDETNDWKLISRKGYSYNENDQYTSHSEVSREINDDNWTALSKESYEYDYSKEFDQLLLPNNPLSFQPFYFHHKITSGILSKKELNNNPYIPYRKIAFYYGNEGTSTNTREQKSYDIKIFPNPANEVIWINSPNKDLPITVELFSVDGQKILTRTLSDVNQINISEVESGIYIYKIYQDKNITTGKICIK